MVKNNYILILLIMIGCLSGCALDKTTPAVDVYTLTPDLNQGDPQTETSPISDYIIALSAIRGPYSLMGPEIIYTDTGQGYNSYAYSRWSDSPVRLLGLFFQQSLQQSQLFAAVIPPESASKSDLLLESSLYDFSHHLENNVSSEGVVKIRFYLIDNKTKTVLATQELSAEVPAKTRDAKGATTALNQASNEVAKQLSTWLSEQIGMMSEK